MNIKRIHLQNFRNHKEYNLSFHQETNLIIGKNGTGKTSILEAISLLSTLRSPRGSLANQMIMSTEDTMLIEAEIVNKNNEGLIRLLFKKNGEKKISVNGRELKKASELLGIFKSVFFSLEDINLVNGGPQNRRRFMDLILIQSSKEYKYNLQNYINIIRQKNELIRRINNKKADEGELDIWDERTAFYGSKIMKERLALINEIKWLIKDMYDKLSDKKELLDLNYMSFVTIKNDEGIGHQETNIYEEFIKQIKLNRQKELKLGMATIGPHRDDIQIKMNKHKVNGYASTGQERSITISFKMAEIEYFKKSDGEYPVILLDDCFVELDRERKEKIWNELDHKIQIILVSTDQKEYTGKKTDVFTSHLLNKKREEICIN